MPLLIATVLGLASMTVALIYVAYIVFQLLAGAGWALTHGD